MALQQDKFKLDLAESRALIESLKLEREKLQAQVTTTTRSGYLIPNSRYISSLFTLPAVAAL
jgi:hypothetical protein